MNAKNKSSKPAIAWIATLMMVGGLALALVGSLNNNMALFVVGVVSLLGAPVLQRVFRAQIFGDLGVWAEAAIAGAGPVPPHDVQLELMERAQAGEDQTTEGIKAAYEKECRRWSAEQSSAPQA